jgi:hypothetical protein
MWRKHFTLWVKQRRRLHTDTPCSGNNGHTLWYRSRKIQASQEKNIFATSKSDGYAAEKIEQTHVIPLSVIRRREHMVKG